MKICSVDIETTGLDPIKDQILEIAVIIDDCFDTAQPVGVEYLPTFHCYVSHLKYSGDAYALAMNAEILSILAKGESKLIIPAQDVAIQLDEFFIENGYAEDKNGQVHGITCAGKNFGSFDLQFLRQLPDWDQYIRLKHRSLDVGSLYFDPAVDTKEIPNLQQCISRSNVASEVQHNAVNDAQDVLRLMRHYYYSKSRIHQ